MNIKGIVYLLCLSATSTVFAYSKDCDIEYNKKSSKPCNKPYNNPCNQPCGQCFDLAEIVDKPLPPYTAQATPDCRPLPPRPYAVPMQGLRYTWTLGTDVYYMYAQAKGDFTQIYRSQKVGMTIYLAQRFRNPFGYEFGYSWTDRKPKTMNTVPGTVFLGQTATVTAADTCKMRLKDTYFDLQAHTRLCKFIESKFILGLGWVRQSLEYNFIPASATDPVQTTIKGFVRKTALTVRVGLGAQALVSDRVGIRFILMYQTMSNVKLRDLPVNVNPSVLHDSLSANFGIYWTFQPLADMHSIDH